MGSNLPVPNQHCNVLYRQTYNTYGAIIAAGLTQDNRVGNDQKVNNTRLSTTTNKGILAGSVVATAGSQTIGAAAGDSSTYDKVVGIAVNDAVGNPFESSSAVGSGKVVYAHGSGTVISTDIYETVEADGTGSISFVYGEKLYASQNGLLTNSSGLNLSPTATGAADRGSITLIGIVLKVPTASDPYMTFQMKL